METSKTTIKEVLLNVESSNGLIRCFYQILKNGHLIQQELCGIWMMQSVTKMSPLKQQKSMVLCSLDIATIQGIVDNARQQITNCDAEHLFRALIYYWYNDAFISFSKEQTFYIVDNT